MDQARWIVVALAGLILWITSFGISNTLVISVLQRATEFGIMKSLGASSAQIMGMMLFEGGVLGSGGAVIAILLSWSLSLGIDHGVRLYIESRIGQEFVGQIFVLQSLDGLIALGVTILVGTLASWFAACRAARLNPIDAFRSV